MKNNTELVFDLRRDDEVRVFARLILELNETGVPYSTEQDGMIVTMTVSNGF